MRLDMAKQTFHAKEYLPTKRAKKSRLIAQSQEKLKEQGVIVWLVVEGHGLLGVCKYSFLERP